MLSATIVYGRTANMTAAAARLLRRETNIFCGTELDDALLNGEEEFCMSIQRVPDQGLKRNRRRPNTCLPQTASFLIRSYSGNFSPYLAREKPHCPGSRNEAESETHFKFGTGKSFKIIGQTQSNKAVVRSRVTLPTSLAWSYRQPEK